MMNLEKIYDKKLELVSIAENYQDPKLKTALVKGFSKMFLRYAEQARHVFSNEKNISNEFINELESIIERTKVITEAQ